MLMQGESLMNVSTGHDTVIYREPLGVFAGIAPFNFPAMIPFGWMVPLCITTGNTCVLKAARAWCPPAGMRLLELLYEAGLPKGVVNVVTCGRNEAEILLTHPRSRASRSSAPPGPACTSTPSPPRTASGSRPRPRPRTTASCCATRRSSAPPRGIINSTFGCAGMRCMALPVVRRRGGRRRRVRRLHRAFAQAAHRRRAYDPKTELGPVVTAEHRQSSRGWIDKAVEEGAELVLDGRDVVVPGYEDGFFVGPTIFDHVTEEMSLRPRRGLRPGAFIKRVEDFEEGLAIMNASRFANGSCIFTESGYYAREFARRTHAGMVGVNVGIPVPVGFFPFSGHKQSFFGDPRPRAGRRALLHRDQVRDHALVLARRKTGGRDVSTWEGTVNRSDGHRVVVLQELHREGWSRT